MDRRVRVPLVPMAERILDGFHIVSWATDALNKVRTAAWHEARKAGTARKGAKDPIKGARWALLKNEGDLTARGDGRRYRCLGAGPLMILRARFRAASIFSQIL